MIRRLVDDVYQIGECVDGLQGHEAVRVYVILNEGRPILIDCGSHLHRRAIMAELESVLGGATPVAVFLTHSELPHSGNLHRVTEAWPDIHVYVSNILLSYIELAPVLPIDQITNVKPGSKIDFAGRELVFLNALLKDQPGSQWIYDPLTRTLFTGDGFGYYHAPGECDVFSREMAEGVQTEQFKAYHQNAFKFLRWVKAERFNSDLDRFFAALPVEIIAPTHGNAITNDVPLHLRRMKQAVQAICASSHELPRELQPVLSSCEIEFEAENAATPGLSESEVRVFGDGIERVGVRAVTPEIFWITHCLGDLAQAYYKDYFSVLPNATDYAGHRVVDYPFSAFLIVDEKCLLIDTVAPRQEEATLEALEFALGGRSLDYLWISHIELPHAGNAHAIMRRHPNARLVSVAGGDHYELHSLQEALLVSPGDVIDLGRHSIEIVDPLFVDHGLSQWAYERRTGLLFTADWGHNLHEPACGQCFQFLDEMLAGGYAIDLLVDDIKVNAWYQFPWLAWTDPDEVASAVTRLFQRYDVRIFAPSHGNLIRADAKRYAGHLAEGMRQASAMSVRL